VAELGGLLGRGTSADVFALPGHRVLKLYFPHIARPVMEREYAAAALADRLGLKVARPLGWDERDGRHGVVFERAEGETLLGRMRRRPLGAVAAMWRLAAWQVAMHRHRIDADLRDQAQVLAHRIAGSQASERARSAAAARLAALAAGGGDRLCHGDLHPGNAFVTAAGLTVIDWSKASRGTPAADAARTELLIRYGQYGRLERRFRAVRLGRHWLAEWYLAAYCALSGTGRAEIAAWRLPVAVGWFRGQDTVIHSPLLAIAERLAR
jgi:thiamine kinase